jgi:hypothetical protein
MEVDALYPSYHGRVYPQIHGSPYDKILPKVLICLAQIDEVYGVPL